jgi:hypothetical protein
LRGSRIVNLLYSPRRRRRLGLTFEPTDEQRYMVELLSAFGIPERAICAELMRQGVQCASDNTLRRKFRAELTNGRDRLVATLGQRVLAIAMSNQTNNLTACQYLLHRIGGPMWREPKEDIADEVPANTGAMIYPRAELERRVEGLQPTIDAEPEPAAETEIVLQAEVTEKRPSKLNHGRRCA